MAPAPVPSTSGTPSAAIIVAIKGAGPWLAEFLDALLGQIYPSYRIVFAVEARSNPAFARLEPLRDSGGQIELVIAGEASGRAQKVHNLLAAARHFTAAGLVVVFADADIVPPTDWLQQLIRLIALHRARVTSGYRKFRSIADCQAGLWHSPTCR